MTFSLRDGVHHKHRSVISIAETDLDEMDLSCGIFGEGPAVFLCGDAISRTTRLAGRKKNMMLLQRKLFFCSRKISVRETLELSLPCRRSVLR